MSHYTVAVFTKPGGKSVEELLEPYSENLKVAPYIFKTKEQIIKEIHKDAAELRERIKKYAAGEYQGIPYWLSDARRNPRVLNKYYENKLLNESKFNDEELYQIYREDNKESTFNEKGDELSTYNPDSKWDWYSLGGRWSGMLKSKNPDDFSDTLRIGDIDFSPDEEDYEDYKRWWEIVIDKKPLKEGEKQPILFYVDEYYQARYNELYKNADDYATHCCAFHTYALLTPEGVWYEPGKMGWFGCDDSTPTSQKEYDKFFDDYLKNVDPNWFLTIVDCHI